MGVPSSGESASSSLAASCVVEKKVGLSAPGPVFRATLQCDPESAAPPASGRSEVARSSRPSPSLSSIVTAPLADSGTLTGVMIRVKPGVILFQPKTVGGLQALSAAHSYTFER